MGLNMKGSGLMIFNMAKELRHGQMDQNMRVNIMKE